MAQVASVRVADHAPMPVGYDVTERNVVAAHEFGGEPGGAVESGGAGVATVFAHLDTDGFSVAGPLIVGVLALLVGGKRLVDGVGIDREMPDEVSERVVFGFQTTPLAETGVGAGSCSRTPVLG